MKGSPRLRALLVSQKDLDATIARARAARSRVSEEITRERARLELERGEFLAELEPKVRAAWESGVALPDIATNYLCTPADVTEIMKQWRQREGVTIRRRRPKTRWEERRLP